jgi:UDP-N-acetylmuramate--alanine ligase
MRAAVPIREGERIHVVGAAGAGASAAALLADSAGATVTACDPGGQSPYTPALEARSIRLAEAHDRTHVRSEAGPIVDRLAVTKALTAIDPYHPELAAARSAGIAVEAWQQVVADAAASRGGRLVAIAGTHGKSTSAGWLVHVLAASGRDPSAFVGALLSSELSGGTAATARWGRGEAFVVEADEYAGNFDPFRPSIAVVLNVEWDHPDVFADHAAVVDTFEAWLRAPGVEERRIVIYVSDRGGADLAARVRDLGDALVPVLDVDGGGPAADSLYRPVRLRLDRESVHIDGLPVPEGDDPGAVRAVLQLPGRHNAANAACVAATAALLGVSSGEIARGLASFGGVARRLEMKGESRGVLVFDDYAHHPTAIRATIAALRVRYPGRRVWAAHEPLTYHRAAAMLDALADALAEADRVVVADIWAGRDPDTTITSAAALAEAVSARMETPATAPGTVEATADELAARVESGDIVLAMGGGRSYVIADRLLALLGEGRSE